MNRHLPDAQALDRHQSLKRWERMSQRASWKRRRGREIEAPLLPCRWRMPGGEIRLLSARLLALFQGDFALAHFQGTPSADSLGLRLLRNGIPWDFWHPWLLRAYLKDSIVPAPFVPLRRIPPLSLEEALRWPSGLQAAFFSKLRETGLLPGPPRLDAAVLAPWMRWEDVKSRFMDFKDNPPPR